MPTHKLEEKQTRRVINSEQRLRAYPENTIMFDTYHEFTFRFVLTRDNYDVSQEPERFRVATAEEIRKYPLL